MPKIRSLIAKRFVDLATFCQNHVLSVSDVLLVFLYYSYISSWCLVVRKWAARQPFYLLNFPIKYRKCLEWFAHVCTSQILSCIAKIPSHSLTWTLKTAPKGIGDYFLETIIFWFHVELGECMMHVFFFIPLYTRTVSCFCVINWKTWKIKTRHIFAYWWFRNPAVTRWGKGSLSLYLQLFIHSRWLFGISSIKRMSSIFVFVWYVIWSKSYSEPCFWCFIYIHHILFSCIITFIFSGFSQHNLFTSLLLDDTGVDFFIRIISYCLFIGFSIYYYMSMCVFFFWAFLCCFIILNS